MDTREKLIQIFKMFPGIGERQASRFVYFFMSRNKTFISNFVNLLLKLNEETKQCSECFRFFSEEGESKNTLCDICRSSNTDHSTILVVERDSDLESIKNSRTYSGKYFVFGSLVPIVENNTKKTTRIEELKKLVANKMKNGEIKEIILAFSLNPQGNHTDFYIRNELRNLVGSDKIKISSLGRGLSTGTELEYSDNDTIRSALLNRQ